MIAPTIIITFLWDNVVWLWKRWQQKRNNSMPEPEPPVLHTHPNDTGQGLYYHSHILDQPGYVHRHKTLTPEPDSPQYPPNL